MAYDLEEQEQIDELKAWWKQYGKMVSSLAGVLLIAYVAYQGWAYFQNKQSLQASTQYQALTIVDEKDLKAIQAQSAALMENFSNTPYAGRAALFAAKADYQSHDIKAAKAPLNWAIKNAQESAVRAMATLQLANILLEEKDLNAAYSLLNAPHDVGFDGLFADLKGDVLRGLGKNSEAKKAYEEALQKLDPQGKLRVLTMQKLQSLG